MRVFSKGGVVMHAVSEGYDAANQRKRLLKKDRRKARRDGMNLSYLVVVFFSIHDDCLHVSVSCPCQVNEFSVYLACKCVVGVRVRVETVHRCLSRQRETPEHLTTIQRQRRDHASRLLFPRPSLVKRRILDGRTNHLTKQLGDK